MKRGTFRGPHLRAVAAGGRPFDRASAGEGRSEAPAGANVIDLSRARQRRAQRLQLDRPPEGTAA
jgi:hypothetical protein